MLALLQDKSIDESLALSLTLESEVPHVFSDDRRMFEAWRRDLSRHLDVDPAAVIVAGSAAVGVSLNPDKKLKAFGANSDVDVAIISQHHFNVAWRWMARLTSTEKYRLPKEAQAAVKNHRLRHIYFGAVATDDLIGHLPFGARWTQAAEAMKARSPVNGRDINFRIYRNRHAFRHYQLVGVRELRTNAQ